MLRTNFATGTGRHRLPLFAASLLALAGCAEPHATRQKVGPQYQLFEVSVESNPPGARIELFGDTLGKAPLAVQVAGTADRRFRDSPEFVAYPTDAGFVQRKHFWGGDPIPRRIVFDMNLEPVPAAVDVRIHQ